MAKDIFEQYAFISLGSNLPSRFGAPHDAVRHAIERLGELSDEPLLVSTLIESRPVGCPPGAPDFVNAVAGLIPSPGETPFSLLKKLQQIENEMGRRRSGTVNESRTIDLDLITFRKEKIASETLTVPHPRARQRAFVMEPLGELVGNEPFPA